MCSARLSGVSLKLHCQLCVSGVPKATLPVVCQQCPQSYAAGCVSGVSPKLHCQLCQQCPQSYTAGCVSAVSPKLHRQLCVSNVPKATLPVVCQQCPQSYTASCVSAVSLQLHCQLCVSSVPKAALPQWPSSKTSLKHTMEPTSPSPWGFFQVELKLGTPLTTLPGVWRYWAKARTGWPGAFIGCSTPFQI